ncbi:MAG: heavy-metal-associated domain-containing protein, partial [Rhodobacteraceae bacterium]|nr:heavy-metal-associated domain-containing protein [Paracoccaceae bacterium]
MQFQIDDMACGGCARSVTRAIHSVDPQTRVEVDLQLRRVTVESAADAATVAAVLAALGFPPRRAA